MIDRERLAELRKLMEAEHEVGEIGSGAYDDLVDFLMFHVRDITESLDKLLTVKEAAEEAATCSCVTECTACDPLLAALAAVKEDVPGKNI